MNITLFVCSMKSIKLIKTTNKGVSVVTSYGIMTFKCVHCSSFEAFHLNSLYLFITVWKDLSAHKGISGPLDHGKLINKLHVTEKSLLKNIKKYYAVCI